MSSKKSITFIVNPISGVHGKEFILHLINKHIDRNQYDYTICKTEYAGHASEIARDAAEKGTKKRTGWENLLKLCISCREK